MAVLGSNLGALQGMAGQEIPVQQLRELQKALRANATSHLAKASVGYPQQGVAFTGDLAPLVPQSIQPTLDSATFLQKHIVFWRELAKYPVTSTLHESNVVREHGYMDMDPFIGEGETGPLSEGTYERKVVRVKYLAEHIEITDVGTMVGITGVNRSALAQRTQDGTLALLGKLERSLFMADSDLSPLHFDGLYKQISAGAPDNVKNNAGKPTSPQQLQEYLGELVEDPNYSAPTVIFTEPRIYQSLVNIATAAGRHDQMRVAGGGGAGGGILTWGHQRLFVGGSMGNVEVRGLPLMSPRRKPAAVAQGADAPDLTAVSITPTTPVDATSTLEAGAYSYKIVAVGDEGASAPKDVDNVVVTAGDNVTLTIDDDAIAATGAGSIRYYRVYRAPKGEIVATNAEFMWQFPRAGVGTDTVIVDRNRYIPGTGRAFILQLTPDVMYWTQLLDFTRRPLAQVKTTVPFLLMLFGALHLKVPTKCMAIDNISLTL